MSAEIQDEMKEVLDQEPVEKTLESSESENAGVDEEAKAELTAEQKQEEEKKRNKVSFKDRINIYRRQVGDRDREIEELRKQNELLKKVSEGNGNAGPRKPNEEDFDTHSEFLAAIDKYADEISEKKAEEKSREREREREREEARRVQEESARRTQSEWAKKQAKAVEKYPEFRKIENEFISDVEAMGAVHIFPDILDSAVGHEIVYYLSNNPEELERITSLQPRAATREIGKLEDKVTVKTVQKKQPPEPVETLRSSGATHTKDINRMSQAEYNEYMNKRERGR